MAERLLFNPISGEFDFVDDGGPASGGEIITGLAGRLAAYAVNGKTLDDEYTQNGNQISVQIAAHAGLPADRQYTIPDVGESTEFVMSNDPRLVVDNQLRVKKNPGPGEFSSVKVAIDSITDNSSTNVYAVYVGPGVFVEDTIAMKPYVTLFGESPESTIIEVNDPDKDVLLGANFSRVSRLTLRGATAVGRAAVKHTTAASEQTAFFVFDCFFGPNDTLVSAVADDTIVRVFVTNCRFGSVGSPYRVGFSATRTGTSDSRIVIRDCTTVSSVAPVDDFVYASGAGCEVALFSVAASVRAFPGGNGVRLRDGAKARVVGCNLRGFAKALFIENVGAGSNLEAFGVLLDECTQDLVVDHPSASGFAQGPVTYSKIDINPASSVYIPGKDLNIVTVFKRGGDFTSLKAAIEAITDASTTNRYLIEVGPGVFVEDTIQLKPFVFVIGVSSQSSIIQVDASTKDLFVGCANTALIAMTLRGPSGAGFATIRYNGVSPGSMRVDRCRMGSAYHLAVVDATSGPAIVITNDTVVETTTVSNTAFVVSGTAFPAGLQLQGFTGNQLVSPALTVTNLVRCQGPLASAFLEAGDFTKGSGLGVGIEVLDGATLRTSGYRLSGFDVGFKSTNTGAAPVIDFSNSSASNNTTYDIDLQHPLTSGNILGSFDRTRLRFDPAITSVSVLVTDPVNQGTLSLGELYLGKKIGDLVPTYDLISEAATMGLIEGGAITDGGGLQVNVASGYGYLMDDVSDALRRFDWAGTMLTIPALSSRYVFVNTSGIVTTAASIPDTTQNIVLGRCVTNATGVELLERTPLDAHHYSNQIDKLLRIALGAVFASGSQVSENVSPRKLNITSGRYFFSEHEFLPAGGTAVTFTAWYRSVTPGVFTRVPGQDTISNSMYDDGSGTLAAIPAGKYAKHSVYVSGGPSETYYMVYAQATYDTLAEAETAPLPNSPTFFTDTVTRIASTVVQQGDANLVRILDERPRFGFNATATAASASHSNLANLDSDDHLQYLLIDGSRAMSGSLNMGGNNVANVGTVDGVDVSAHASRHLPNGADPLATAAANQIGANAVASVGIQNTLSRSDHTHSVATAAVVSQVPGQANTAGTSNNLARADHLHEIPTGTAITLSATSINAEGTALTFSRSDHSHDLSTGNVLAQVPGQANTEGTSANLARADHLHEIPTGIAVTLGATSVNAEGTALTFSRSDHSHDLSTGVVVAQVPDQTNAEGTSADLARADHVHNLLTAAPVTIGLANAQGSAASFSRSDHVHSHGSQTDPTLHAVATSLVNGFLSSADWTTFNNKQDFIVAGTVAQYYRGDKTFQTLDTAAVPENGNLYFTTARARLAISAAAPVTYDNVTGVIGVTVAAAVTLSAATANGAGVAASLSRSDHTHAISTGVVSTQLADQANSAGTSANLARADHVHNIPTAAPVTIGTANAQGASTSFAKADHVHAHGAQTDPTLHAVATSLVNGFLSSADWTTFNNKQDFITPGTTAQYYRGDKTFQTLNTTVVAEGTNLYYTQARFDTAFAAKSTTNLAEGSNLYFTTARARLAISATAPVTYDNVTGVISATFAAAVTLSAATANGAGAAASFSRSDHTHAISTGAASSQTPDQANATGTSANLARADHVHNLLTAAPLANLTAITTNAQGSAASFSRSDHSHAISTAAPVALTPGNANAVGTSASLARADHVHPVNTAYLFYQQSADATATATGTYVTIPMGTSVLAFGNGFLDKPATNTFRALVGCVVRVSYTVAVDSTANETGFRLRALRNSTTEVAASSVIGTSRDSILENSSGVCTFVVELAANDTVELQITRLEGSNIIAVSGSDSHMLFELVRLT